MVNKARIPFVIKGSLSKEFLEKKGYKPLAELCPDLFNRKFRTKIVMEPVNIDHIKNIKILSSKANYNE